MRQREYVRWLTLQCYRGKTKQPKIMLASDLEAQQNNHLFHQMFYSMVELSWLICTLSPVFMRTGPQVDAMSVTSELSDS